VNLECLKLGQERISCQADFRRITNSFSNGYMHIAMERSEPRSLGETNPQKVAKTIPTMKGGILPTELDSILDDVKAKTVDAFFRNPELFNKRSQRLTELRRLLVNL
jgi:hypothetical protein